MALKAKQLVFVHEYVKDLNATAAYKRAGYKGVGRTAENNASRMLGNAGVKAAIIEAAAARAQQKAAEEDEVLWEYRQLAFNDLTEIFETAPDGRVQLRPLKDWPESVSRSLASIKVKQSREKKPDGSFEPFEILEIRLHSKPEALKALGQNRGLFKQLHQHAGNLTIHRENDLAKLTDEELDALERRNRAGARAAPDRA